jgi:TRAP-type mannitol/chloroaromatic compound transport system substrate-binding protein
MTRKLSLSIVFFCMIAILTFSISQLAIAASVDKNGVIHWKAQSTWIRGPGHQELADYFAETLNDLCKGELVIDKMYAGGELVGAFEAIPACSKGKLDIVSGSGFYLTGTLPWISLIIGAVATDMRYADQLLTWQWEGGGLELYQEYVDSKYNLKVFPYVVTPAQVIYSTKPITKKEDFKGLKIRTTGSVNMEFYKSLGAQAVTMPMSEIIPALERKVVDAAKFSLPYTDYPVKIPEIAPYALSGILDMPVTISMEMWINGDSWKALPEDLKEKVKYAVKLSQYWSIYHLGWKNARLWGKMLDEGLKVTKASPALQQWMNEKAEELGKKYAAQDPFAKKILDSQEEFLKTYNRYYGYSVFFR